MHSDNLGVYFVCRSEAGRLIYRAPSLEAADDFVARLPWHIPVYIDGDEDRGWAVHVNRDKGRLVVAARIAAKASSSSATAR